jgi:hypothetical protein
MKFRKGEHSYVHSENDSRQMSRIVKAIQHRSAAMKSHPLHGCLFRVEMNTWKDGMPWMCCKQNNTMDTTKEGGPIMMDMGNTNDWKALTCNAVECTIRLIEWLWLMSISRSVKKEERRWRSPQRSFFMFVDGVIQCVLATENVEGLCRTKHEIRHDHGRHGVNTKHYGLPLCCADGRMYCSKTIRKVVRAHRDVHCCIFHWMQCRSEPLCITCLMESGLGGIGMQYRKVDRHLPFSVVNNLWTNRGVGFCWGGVDESKLFSWWCVDERSGHPLKHAASVNWKTSSRHHLRLFHNGCREMFWGWTLPGNVFVG